MEKCAGKKFIKDGQLLSIERFDAELQRSGITIYEVMRVIQGIYLFLQDHLERLQKSADVAHIQLWYKESDIITNLKTLSLENKLETGNVKLVFHISDNAKIFMAYCIASSYPSKEVYRQGVKTRLLEAERINPNVKIFNPSLRSKADAFIDDTGIYEALLVNKKGYITEGNRSNVFFIHGNDVITPPEEEVLPGITRDKVIALCEKLKINLQQKPVHISQLSEFTAVFLTGTSPKVLPVRNIHNHKYVTDHPLLVKLMDAYNNEIDRYISG
ncbi:MAG: aminotransferase class IV family protein [Bacteroidales bacterium]|nr:aminotransferase class IV family protein [Bacteroidales bacterium]